MVTNCKGCATTLKGWKQRIAGYCPSCAQKAREGFSNMGKGNMKEGIKTVTELTFGKKEAEKKTAIISEAVITKRKKIEKKLRNRGLTEEQIKEGLDKFNP